MSIGKGIAILGIWGAVAAIAFSSAGTFIAVIAVVGFFALIATIVIAFCD